MQFVGAQQLPKDVGQDPAVAIVRRLTAASNQSRLLKGGCGCGDRGHVPRSHSDTPHTVISRSGRDRPRPPPLVVTTQQDGDWRAPFSVLPSIEDHTASLCCGFEPGQTARQNQRLLSVAPHQY